MSNGLESAERKLDAPEAERALLAGILLEPAKLEAISLDVTVEDFTHPSNRATWKAMLELWTDGIDLDQVTLIERLNEHGAFTERLDTYRFVRDLEPDFDAQFPDAYAKTITRYGEERRVRQTLIALANDPRSVTEIVEDAMRLLPRALQADIRIYSAQDIAALGMQILEDVATAVAEGRPVGLESGISDLDGLIAPLDPGDMTMIGAATSMGKSATCTSMMRYMAKAGNAGALLSLEDSARLIAPRILAGESRVSTGRWRRGQTSDDEVSRIGIAAHRVGTLPFWVVDDVGGIGTAAICRTIRLLHYRHQIKVVFVDYLQQIWDTETMRMNRTYQLGYAARLIKSTCKRLGIHLVMGAQLVKEADERIPKRSDVRDSGESVNAADNILLLYRDRRSAEDNQNIDVYIDKNKQGMCVKVPLNFHAPTTTVENKRVR